MINGPTIVGCGTLGATLALNLAEKRLVSKLTIYDFDSVSLGSYPFEPCDVGVSKVKVLEFHCKKLNPDLNIIAHEKRVLQPLNTNDFVIDCRDCKRPSINSSIRLSLDGHLLYIDSSKKYSTSKNYHRYIYPKNPDFIETAVSNIINYLMNDEYSYHQLRLYNIKKSEQYNLK